MRCSCHWLAFLSCAADNIKVSALSEVPENLASLNIREIPKSALRQTRYANITDSGRVYVECHSTFDGRDLKRLIGQFSVSLEVLTLGPRGRNEAYPQVAVHFYVPTTSLTRKRDDSRPISSCPDHLTFLLSRCVRSQGAQAWSAVCKSPRTGDRSIRWAECADNELWEILPLRDPSRPYEKAKSHAGSSILSLMKFPFLQWSFREARHWSPQNQQVDLPLLFA